MHKNPSNWHIVGVTLLYQLGLLGLIVLFIYFNHPQLNGADIDRILSAWDAHHYLYLSQYGYQQTGYESNFIVFFPFYPALIALLSQIIPNPYIAGLVISIVSSIIGHIFFIKFLFEIGCDRSQCWRIALLFFLTPITVYFSIIYTEGVFLAETALFLFFLAKRNYSVAALIGFCASLTRIFGGLFIIPYVAHFIETRSWRSHFWQLIQGGIIPLGVCIYLFINFALFSDPFHFQIAQASIWHKEVTNPIDQYMQQIVYFLQGRKQEQFTVYIDILATLSVVPLILFYGFLKITGHSVKMSYGLILWMSAQLWLICSQSFWLSNTRYISLILPIYILLEEILWRRPILYALIILIFATLAIHGIYLFSVGGWLY
jgi:hypothetical protein